MTRFGIQGYEPQWLSGRAAVDRAHGARLATVAGQRLRHLWLVWDLTDDMWFADAPVLVELADDVLSVDHQKFDELCLTWNVLDPTRAIHWWGDPRYHRFAVTGTGT